MCYVARRIRAFLWIRWQLIVLTILYAAAVWAVAHYYIESSTLEVSYIATRPLDQNRRLLPDDIGRPISGPGTWGWFLPDRETLEGRYVKKHIPPGHPIESSNLQPLPDLIVDAHHRPVIFPLEKQPQLSAFLNANSYVDVMGNAPPPVASQVRIHAVICLTSLPSDKSNPPCYAILAVPTANEPALSAGKIAMFRLVPTPPPKH
jgi:hypothetical protein